MQQECGRAVVLLYLAAVYLIKDGVGQLLAKLHAPLVITEDVPDDPLYKYLVLIQRNQRPQGFRCKLFDQEGIRRLVPGKNKLIYDTLTDMVCFTKKIKNCRNKNKCNKLKMRI